MKFPVLFATSLLIFAAPALAEEDEVEVKLEDCPKAVQEAIKKESAGGRIKEIEKETEDGKIVYEAEIVIGKEVWEFVFDTEGTLLEKEKEGTEDNDK